MTNWGCRGRDPANAGLLQRPVPAPGVGVACFVAVAVSG